MAKPNGTKSSVQASWLTTAASLDVGFESNISLAKQTLGIRQVNQLMRRKAT